MTARVMLYRCPCGLDGSYALEPGQEPPMDPTFRVLCPECEHAEAARIQTWTGTAGVLAGAQAEVA